MCVIEDKLTDDMGTREAELSFYLQAVATHITINDQAISDKGISISIEKPHSCKISLACDASTMETHFSFRLEVPSAK